LLTTMRSTLKRAEEKGIKTLAFPAMGAGYYGIPAPVSARVMLEALGAHLAGKTGITEVIISVFDTPQYDAFQAALAAQS
ncbi:macro domain-containing protein, partial [Gemmatimonadota bacterium]